MTGVQTCALPIYDSVEEAHQEYSKSGAVIEEVIVQGEALSKIHVGSVNTLRIPTAIIKDEEGRPELITGCINEIGARQAADNVSNLLGEEAFKEQVQQLQEVDKKGYVLRTYPLVLSSWRKGILSVRILISNPSVRSMNDQFRTLVTRNFACDINRIFLRCGTHGSTGITLAFDLPTAIGMRCHMLIFTHSRSPHFKRVTRPQ